MARRSTIGASPLDAVIPIRTTVEEEPKETQERERTTFHLSVGLVERMRNIVFWSPGLTMGELAEEGLLHAVEAREKKNNGPFPPRQGELKGGRQVKGVARAK